MWTVPAASAYTLAKPVVALHLLPLALHVSVAYTGDGAGCLVGMPHDFLKAVVKKDCGVELPEAEDYGVGMCFLPNADKVLYAKAKAIITDVAERLGHEILGWRQVPTDPTDVGPSALATQPVVEQIFLSNSCQETYCRTDAEQQVSAAGIGLKPMTSCVQSMRSTKGRVCAHMHEHA